VGKQLTVKIILLGNVTKIIGLEKWTRHVARMWEKRNAYRLLAGIQEERDH
jgi:hypothetical protein